MPDAHILHEISDALRALVPKADAAGSTTARSILIMSASLIRDLAMRFIVSARAADTQSVPYQHDADWQFPLCRRVS